MSSVLKRLLQIITGLVVIALGYIPAVVYKDATALVVTVPIGLYLIFTKERIY